MIDLKRIYRFAGCFLLGTSLFSPVHANPDDDPLGQFIQQKQAEQKAAQPDNTDELGDLIRQRTNSNARAQRPSAAAEQPAPRHNAAPACHTNQQIAHSPCCISHSCAPIQQPRRCGRFNFQRNGIFGCRVSFWWHIAHRF